MSNKLALTIATDDYDHFRDLRFGLVRPEGIEVTYLCMEIHEVFSRFIFNREFDVSELSSAKFSALVSEPDSDVIGLPVFPSRQFRFSSFYVNRHKVGTMRVNSSGHASREWDTGHGQYVPWAGSGFLADRRARRCPIEQVVQARPASDKEPLTD